MVIVVMEILLMVMWKAGGHVENSFLHLKAKWFSTSFEKKKNSIDQNVPSHWKIIFLSIVFYNELSTHQSYNPEAGTL